MGTTMDHSTTAAADSVIPLDTYNIFEHWIFEHWTSIGLHWTSIFGSLLLIFFFNDHSILWVVQYIHTTAVAAASVIPLDTYKI